jgi:F0F1-type ATP synthase delta subunit
MIQPADCIEILKTKDEAQQCKTELNNLIEGLFSNKSFAELVSEYVSYQKKDLLFALLEKYHIDTKNLSQTQAFLQELQSAIDALPVATLTLAFSPKQGLITTLSGWFAVHAKKIVLLDIMVNKRLLGGVIISYNGIYKDYSLKRSFEEKYKNNEELLLQV